MEREKECRVTVLGEEGVGKSALLNSFSREEFIKDSIKREKRVYTKSAMVANKKVHFIISECSNFDDLTSSPLLTPDVFLLCFSISDHASLYSVLDHWLPAVKAISPATPAVLVGCKSDLRTSGRLQRLVSADHALSLSRQSETVMYVETSSVSGDIRSISAPFEVAALAAFGQFQRQPSSSSVRSKEFDRTKSRDMSEPRARSSRTRLNCLSSPVELGKEKGRGRTPVNRFLSNSEIGTNRSGSVGSVSLQSKTSTLSSTGSEQSSVSCDSNSDQSTGIVSANLTSPVLNVNTIRTPGIMRKVGRRNQSAKSEDMVTIKCQRLREDRTYEEIDIEVPAEVYNNIQMPGDLSQCTRNSRERKSFGNKLKSLLMKS